MTMRRAARWIGAVLGIVLLMGAALPAEPLIEAARRGDAEAVRSLLRDGADPNRAQGDGLTALHVAAERGDLGIGDRKSVV